MIRSRALRRPNGSGPLRSRSVRVDDPEWDAAVARATTEGTTVSAVIVAFLRGYGAHKISMPKTHVVYTERTRKS